jgi:hypothetical protein
MCAKLRIKLKAQSLKPKAKLEIWKIENLEIDMPYYLAMLYFQRPTSNVQRPTANGQRPSINRQH